MQRLLSCYYVSACLSVPEMSTLPKLFVCICFSVCLLIWKQNIRNIETLHSISMENPLTFAESHFKVFSHDIFQHGWPSTFMPVAALKGIRTSTGGRATQRENVSRDCSNPSSHQVFCSNRNSFNHRLQFISKGI